MKVESQNLRKLLLLIGMVLGVLILSTMQSKAQSETEPVKAYKCAPCGCSADDTLVIGPGNCQTCGMKLINIHNPDEGLNYKNLNGVQVCQLIATNQSLLILDVRSAGEFAQRSTQIGRLKNALNIPISELADRLEELAEYKDKEILIYCSISARSTRASHLLADNGFKKVKNMMGGLNFWNEQSLDNIPCRDSVIRND